MTGRQDAPAPEALVVLVEATRRASPVAPQPLATLNRWATERRLALPDGTALRFVDAGQRRLPALAYERRIVERGEIATRAGSRHDYLNALAWLAFPRTKAALSAVHVSAGEGAGGRRGAARDAATLLDEHGAIVLATDAALLARWREHAWGDVFGAAGSEVRRTMRLAVLGHGLAAKCAAPYPTLTAHVLAVPVQALPAEPAIEAFDDTAAAWLKIRGHRLCPADLLRLPLVAWPGWTGAAHPLDFADARIFRARTRSRLGAAPSL